MPPSPHPVAIVAKRNSLHHTGVFSQTPRKSANKMLELKPRPTFDPPRARTAAEKQPRRLLLALIILMVALGVVVINDRQFWFGTQNANLEPDEPSTVAHKPATPAPAAKPVVVPKSPSAKKIAANAAQAAPTATPAVTTQRTVLPPLDIEVIAGDKHRTVRSGSNATKVELTNPAATRQPAPARNAAEREPLAATATSASATLPSYPALTQHASVQGSVVLQALISADGAVENLRILSGPAILATAAQQAVREWRFKPMLQDGRPVETKATITVNFTIKVGGNPEATTLAESRTDGLLIFTR